MSTDDQTPPVEPSHEVQRPGSSLDLIIGALGNDPSIPTDLASRHDEYLYSSPSPTGE